MRRRSASIDDLRIGEGDIRVQPRVSEVGGAG
jgi:hypothetical protein